MNGTDYSFSNSQDRYQVCAEILESVKNAKTMRKMKHVKRYMIIYRIFDEYGNNVYDGNATKNWLLMKDEISKVKIGSINISCIEEFKY